MEELKAFGIEAGQGKYDEEAFYGLVLVYTMLFDRVSRYLDQWQLTPAKMNVLMIIKHQGGRDGLSQKDIGRKLMVTASNMTRLLEKLEREKLVERQGREGDRRVKVIRVSKRGSELLDKAWPGYMKTMKDVMGKLSVQDQKVLAKMMQDWFRALKG